MKFSLLILLSIALAVSSCKSSKQMPEIFDTPLLSLPTNSDCKDSPGQGIDSFVGTISCNDITISYDYGLYGNRGPSVPTEKIRPTFDTYHHIKFFDSLLIDKRVHPIFLSMHDAASE